MNPETVARLLRAVISNFYRRYGSTGAPERALQGDFEFHDWVFAYVLFRMLGMSEQEAGATSRLIPLPVSLTRVSSYSEQTAGGVVVIRMTLAVIADGPRNLIMQAKKCGNTCTIRVSSDPRLGQTWYGTMRAGGWVRESNPPQSAAGGRASTTHQSRQRHNHGHSHP